MNDPGNTRGGAWVVAQNVLMVAGLVVAPLRCCDWSGDWSQPVGVVFMVTGAVFGVAGVRALGRNLTPFPRPREDSQLVQHGIYAFVRHPLYACVVFVTAGWALYWRSLGAVITTVLLGVVLDAKARLEERWLREKFPGYLEYARRVRRFVPWIY